VSRICIVTTCISDSSIETVLRRNQFSFLEELCLELHGSHLPLSAMKMIIDIIARSLCS
jgi:hypothetical protein